jgi:hypothetical protein
MYQILPLPLIVTVAIWLAVSVLLLVTRWLEFIPIVEAMHGTVLLTNLVLALLTVKPVWRRLWRCRWIPWLGSWFPDLNGDYDVELHHNWPIQQRLLEAAAGGDRFDPRGADTQLPILGTTRLRATIDVGFYGVHVDMWAENPDEPSSVIDHSRTLVSVLKRPCDGQPHRLVYVYQQKNRRDRRATTDDSTFEGAAMLDIRASVPNELKGEYWTNRAWHQGLSTAGIITFKKRDVPAT